MIYKNIDIGSSIYQRDRYLSRRSANHRKKNDQINLRERTMTCGKLKSKANLLTISKYIYPILNLDFSKPQPESYK